MIRSGIQTQIYFAAFSLNALRIPIGHVMPRCEQKKGPPESSLSLGRKTPRRAYDGETPYALLRLPPANRNPQSVDAVSYAPRNAIFTGIDVVAVVAVGAM